MSAAVKIRTSGVLALVGADGRRGVVVADRTFALVVLGDSAPRASDTAVRLAAGEAGATNATISSADLYGGTTVF
jgi:hypothetical protein